MKLLRVIAALFLMSVAASAAQFPSSSSMFVGAFGPTSSCIQGGNDSFTKALLHFDGSLIDSNLGGSPKTWTQTGTGTGPTAAPKFGTNSLTAPNPRPPNGSTSATRWVQTTDNGDLAFGSGNFTIDFWMNLQACVPDFQGNNAVNSFAGQQASGSLGRGWIFRTPNACSNASNYTLAFLAINQSGSSIANINKTVVGTGWHHIAVVRNGTSFTLYVDGSAGTTATSSAAVGFDGAIPITIGVGAAANSTGSNAFIDEFRISVGIARWTSNFTPPTAPYCP